MSDDTIRVSRAAADSLCDSWHTRAHEYENESPVRAAIFRCVDELEALIAATPQEPKRFASNVRSLLQEIAEHGGGTLPLFLARRLNDVLAADSESAPQEPKRRFTPPVYAAALQWAVNEANRQRLHGEHAALLDLLEAEASESGECGKLLVTARDWRCTLPKGHEHNCEGWASSESGEQPISEGFAGCSCGRDWGHDSNCDALGGD